VPHRRVDRVRQIRTKALSKTVPIVLSSFFHTPGCFQRFRMSDRRQIKNPGRRKGLCRPELLSRYGDATHTYKTVPVIAKSYALGSVQPPDITRTCALASLQLIAHANLGRDPLKMLSCNVSQYVQDATTRCSLGFSIVCRRFKLLSSFSASAPDVFPAICLSRNEPAVPPFHGVRS
jgi:hypothetical protein